MDLLQVFNIMNETLTQEHLNDPSITLFIQALCLELNFKDACKRAGVGEARGKSYFRQPDITACIDKIRELYKSSNSLKGDMLVKQLEDMAEVDPLDIFDDYGLVKPLKDIPAHVRRAFKKFKVKYEYIDDMNGVQQKVPTVYDIELHDKTRAIELIGTDLDRFKKKSEHKHTHELGQNAGKILLGQSVNKADERMKELEMRDVTKKENSNDKN